MPRKLSTALASLALLLLLASGARADTVTITFEESDPYVTAQSAGLRLASKCPTENDLHPCTGPPIKPYGAAGNKALFPPTFTTTYTNIIGMFTTPIGGQAVTSFLAFDVVGSGLSQNSFYTINIYDYDAKLIGTETGTTDRRVTFSYSVPTIGFFTFFGGSPQQGIDNVTFEHVQTPEPATLVLLGTGLAGIAAKVRRRRRKV